MVFPLVLSLLVLFISVKCIRNYMPFYKPRYLELARKDNQKYEYPTIDNLFEFLSPYEAQQCMIILDNFQGIDVSLNSPVIIRRLVELVATKRVRVKSQSFFHIFGPENLATRNFTISFTCPLSKFLTHKVHLKSVEYGKHEMFCYNLNLQMFWKNSKPWNCFVQIKLFPPDFYFNLHVPLKLYSHHVGDISNYEFVFPNSIINSVQMFIMEQDLTNYQLQQLTNRNNLMCGEVFLRVIYQLNKSQSAPISLSGQIAKIEKLQLMSLCRTVRDAKLSLSKIEKSWASDFTMLSDVTVPGPRYNLIWQLSLFSTSDNVISRMVHSLLDCTNLKSFRQVHSYQTLVERLANGYAHVWISIMKNFTLVDDRQFVQCWSEESSSIKKFIYYADTRLEFDPYIQGILYFPHFPYDPTSQLRFLSCGERGHSSLPFHYLTTVFDEWIWFHIIACSLTL